MIVKNEEKYLKDCLESVKGVVDEIIIVDTGSSDGTLRIAREYGARIFYFDWINDFSAARNYSLKQCTGNWILYLDADERLSAKSINQLKSLTRKKDKIAYYCRVCSIDEVNNRPSIMSYVRLFPNVDGLSFEGAVHEQIEYSLKQNKIRFTNSTIEIIHAGYNLTKDGLLLKAKRNLEILLKEYNREHSSYYAFQLAQTYGILDEKKTAIEYFLISIKDQSLKPEYKSTAYRYLAIDLAEKQDWKGALDLIGKSIENDSNQPLALLTAAKIYVKLSLFNEAERYCMKAFDVNSKYLKEIRHSSQVILLAEKDFLYHGLNIAVLSGNTKLFNFLYEMFKSLSIAGTDKDYNNELKLFDILLNNKSVETENIDELIKSVNLKNLEILSSLLENYNIMQLKIVFFRKLSEKFPANSSILNKYALSLSKINGYKDAEKILEKSFSVNPEDPSTIFYLISLYLQNDNFIKIKPLIEFAEDKFSLIPGIIDKLHIIRQKLGLLI
jgi:glycosyltransferase involved in cell wall biosynthesis